MIKALLYIFPILQEIYSYPLLKFFLYISYSKTIQVLINLSQLYNFRKKGKCRMFLVQSAKISSFFEIMRISRRTSRRESSCRRRDDETTTTTARDERGALLLLDARDPETRIARGPRPHRQSLENRR